MKLGFRQVNSFMGLLMFCAVLQVGCGQLEIEDRAFPLALAVTPTERMGQYEFSFFFEETDAEESGRYHKEDARVTAAGYPQAFTLFGRTQAAKLDDSHMQVLLLSEDLLNDNEFLESFFQYFMKDHHFSWNTMVYLLDEHSIATEQLRESTGGRVGTYLRDMAESDEQEKTANVPTLGDLYKEWNNHEKVLLLPILAQSAPPSVVQYRLLAFGKPARLLNMDEARMLQLLRGDLNEIQIQLPDGTVVAAEGIRLRREYIQERDVWRVTVRMEAKTENRIKPSADEREQIIQSCTNILYKQINQMEQWSLIQDGQGNFLWPEYRIDICWTE